MASSCWGLSEALCDFPSLSNKSLRLMRKTIDDGFRDLVRQFSDQIDAATRPLQWFLNTLENIFTGTPWFVMLVLILAVVWFASRSMKIAP